jgi:hypothetical protein
VGGIDQALSTVASIAATLAGFSGLAIAFGRGQDGLSFAQKLTVRVMMVVSISAMLFALAPLPFLVGGARPDVVWTIGLGLLTVHLFYFAIAVPLDLRRRKLPLRWKTFLTFNSVQVGVGLTMLLGTLDVAGLRSPATYLFGLVWLITVAALQLIVHVHATLDFDDDPPPSNPTGETP